jgi:hypothetical protein
MNFNSNVTVLLLNCSNWLAGVYTRAVTEVQHISHELNKTTQLTHDLSLPILNKQIFCIGYLRWISCFQNNIDIVHLLTGPHQHNLNLKSVCLQHHSMLHTYILYSETAHTDVPTMVLKLRVALISQYCFTCINKTQTTVVLRMYYCLVCIHLL